MTPSMTKFLAEAVTLTWIAKELASKDPFNYYRLNKTCRYCFLLGKPLSFSKVTDHKEKCVWRVAKEFINGEDAG